MTEARLYYEAHVTVEKGDDWEGFAARARALDWRASKFDEDEVDDMSDKWFLSFRHRNLDATVRAVGSMVDLLKSRGCPVLRWKIEDTVMDSKHGDVLEEVT